jgi:hypothetical protein
MADWGMSDPDFVPVKSKSGNATWGLSDPDSDEGIPLPPTRPQETKESSFTGALVGEPTSETAAAPSPSTETSIALGGAPINRDPSTEKSIGQQFYENVPGAKMASRSLVGQKAGFWFDRLDKQRKMEEAIAQGTYIAPIQQKEINDQAEQARQKLPELLGEYAQINSDLEVETASGEKRTVGQLYKEGDYSTLLSQIGKEFMIEPLVAGAPFIASAIAGGPAAPLTAGAYGAADAYSNTLIEETIKRGGDPKDLDNFVKVFEANRDEIMSTAGKKGAIGGGFGAVLGAGPGSQSIKQFFGNLLGFYAPVSTLQTAAMREATQTPVINPDTGEPVIMPDGKVLMEDLPPMTAGETAETYAKAAVAGAPFALSKIRVPERAAKPQAPEVPPTLPPFRGQGPETPPPSGQGPAGRGQEALPSARPPKPVDLDAAAVLKADGWSISEIAMMSPRQQKAKADKAVKERNVKPAPLTPEEITALSPEPEAPAAPSSPEPVVEARGPADVLPSSSAPPAAPSSAAKPRQAPSDVATKLVEEGVPPLEAMQRAATETPEPPKSSILEDAALIRAYGFSVEQIKSMPETKRIESANYAREQGTVPAQLTPQEVQFLEPTPVKMPEVAMPQMPQRIAQTPVTLEQIKPYLPTDAAGNPNYGALQQKIVEIAGPDKFLKDLTPEQGGRLLAEFGVPIEAAPAVAEPLPSSMPVSEPEAAVEAPKKPEKTIDNFIDEYRDQLKYQQKNGFNAVTPYMLASEASKAGFIAEGQLEQIRTASAEEANSIYAKALLDAKERGVAPTVKAPKASPSVKPVKQTKAKAVEAPAVQMESVEGNTYGSMNAGRLVAMVTLNPQVSREVKGKSFDEAGNGKIKVRLDPSAIPPSGGDITETLNSVRSAVKEVIVAEDAYKGLSEKKVRELNDALKKIEDAGGKVTLEGEPPTFSKKKRSRPTSELGSFIAAEGGINGYNKKTGKPSQEFQRIAERRLPGLVRKTGGLDLWDAVQAATTAGYYPEWRGSINETRRYDDDSQNEKIQTLIDDLEAGGVYLNGVRKTGKRREAVLEEQEDLYEEIAAGLRGDLRVAGIVEHPDVFNLAVNLLARGDVADGYEAYELAALEVAMEDPSVLEPVIHDITGEDYWSTIAEQKRNAEGEALPAEFEPMEAELAYETEPSPAPEAGAIRREGVEREERPAAKAEPEGSGKGVQKPVSGKAEGELTLKEAQKILDEYLAPGSTVDKPLGGEYAGPTIKFNNVSAGQVETLPTKNREDFISWAKSVQKLEDEFRPLSAEEAQKMIDASLRPGYKVKLSVKTSRFPEGHTLLISSPTERGRASEPFPIGNNKKDLQDWIKGVMRVVPEEAAKPKEGITFVSKKRINLGPVDGFITRLTLSNGKEIDIYHQKGDGGMQLNGWHYVNNADQGPVTGKGWEAYRVGYIADNLDQAIENVVERQNKLAKETPPQKEEAKPTPSVTGESEKMSRILGGFIRQEVSLRTNPTKEATDITYEGEKIAEVKGAVTQEKVLKSILEKVLDAYKKDGRVMPREPLDMTLDEFTIAAALNRMIPEFEISLADFDKVLKVGPDKTFTVDYAGLYKKIKEQGKVAEEKGAEGKPQLVVPGAERISDKELAERKAEAPMRAKVEQKEAGGLFGEDHLQNELKFMRQLEDEGKIVGYHGTTDIVERFAPEKTKLKRGVFFSLKPELANRFADRTAIGEDPLKYRGDFPDEEVIGFVEEVLGKNDADKAARLIEQYDAAARHDDSLEKIGVDWESPERVALRKEYNAASRDLNKILMTASSMVEGKPNVTKVIIKPGKVYSYSFDKEFDWAEEEAAIKFARDNGYDTVKFNLPNSRFGDDEFYSVLNEKNIEPFYSKRYSPPAIQVFSPQEQETAQQLYKEFEGIVRRTIGEKASVKFVKSIQTGMESKLAAGAYDRVSNAIYLATDLEKGASLEDAVYHEAWHVIEDLLAPKELEALDRYRAVTNKKVAQFYKVPVETIEALPKTEQDAYAMGMFGAMKDAGMKMGHGSLPTPVYETLQKSYLTFLRFRNAVKKTVGMRDPDTIFTDFYIGNMRDRIMERTEDMAEALGFDQSVQYQKMRRRTPQGPQRWSVPKENFGAELMHNFVDRYYDWTRVQRAIEASKGAPLKEPLDVELSIQLMQDKAIAKQNKIWEEEAVALLAEMEANKITAKEFGTFLYAQHARERNARMFARDPSRFNGNNGSGMTNAEAAQFLASLSPAKRSKMEQLYRDHIRKMIQADLDYRLDNDLLTQDQYDNLILPYSQGGYDYYVPLTGYAEDEADATNDIPNVGRGFAVWGKEYKVAFGRKSLALNPLFSVIQRRMDGVVRVEKNNTDMTVYRLLKDNPNPEFASVYTPQNLPKRPVLRADGTVQYIPDFAEARSEYTLPLKIGGQPIYIVFNRDNESASRLVRQMKNLTGEQPGIAMRGVLAMGRFMSKVNTQWVPDFFLVNLPRDIQDALITIYSTREGFATNFLKEFTTAGNIIRKVNMKQKLSPDEQKYYDEWTQHGGRMDFGGFSTLLKTQETIGNEFASILERPKGTAAQVNRYLKKTGDLTLGTIEKVNQVFDDTVRLAVYIAARRDPKNQYTPDRAAQLSRRATVDFRQRGDKMPFLNAMKPFLGVGITGARNLSRIVRSKRGLRALFYMILLGVLTAILGYAMSEDDETDPTKKKYFTQINSWERAKSIVLPIPINGEYVKIPLGFYGLVAFGLGDQLVGVATGNIKPMDAATNIGSSLLASFVPFYSGDWVNSILPWVAAPFVQLGTNRNWLGNPIFPDQDTNMPQSSQAFEKTPDWAKSAAELMNRLSNGSYTEPGWVDVYPATLSYFFDFFGGSAKTFASSSYESFRKLMEGEEFKATDMPFVRRLVAKDTADRTSFYNIRNEIKQSVAQARAAQKILKDPKADDQKKADARATLSGLSKELGIRATPDGISTKYSVVEQFDKADDRIKVLNDLIKKTQDSDMSSEEKRSRIENLEASKKQVMDAARSRYIRRNPSPQSPLDAINEMLQ